MMLRNWWLSLLRREKIALGAGVIFLFVTAIYLVLEPVVEERERMAAEIPGLKEDLEWMQARVDEINGLRERGTGVNTSAPVILTPVMVEDALRRAGLLQQVTDMKQGSGQDVVVVFDKIPFGRLMDFLFDLKSSSGARIKFARISRLNDDTGHVSASLTLISRRS